MRPPFTPFALQYPAVTVMPRTLTVAICRQLTLEERQAMARTNKPADDTEIPPRDGEMPPYNPGPFQPKPTPWIEKHAPKLIFAVVAGIIIFMAYTSTSTPAG